MYTVTFKDRSKRERFAPLAQPYEIIVELPRLENWTVEEHKRIRQTRDDLIKKVVDYFGRDNKRWFYSEVNQRPHGHCLYFCFADKADAALLRMIL